MRKDTIKFLNNKSVKMVAHRGVSGLETENTAAAFIAAGNRTYYGIETDIWRTLDGKFICNHDGKTGRICDIDLVVEENSFDDLRALTLRGVDGESDRKELMLASLSEYIKICKKYGKIGVLELKSNFTPEEINMILDEIKAADYLDGICFIAFNIVNLELVKAADPTRTCQFLTGKWDDSLPEMLASKGMDLDIHFSQLTKERIDACHKAGVLVNCWTVDTVADAEMLQEYGVDFITSNILE